jgi:hypothetical protein
LLLLAAGCVDLDRPRAFRCDNGGGCTGGWVCLKDHYCHSPDAGADVACDKKEDCTGGWFCGQERRCLDPRIPAAYSCADDTQCASPWRCSSEGRCVDLSLEPRALAFPTSTSDPTLVSPLTDVGEQLRAAPLQYLPYTEGLISSFQSTFMVGNDLEVAHLSGLETPWATLFLAERRIAATLPEPPRDLAIAGGIPLVLMPSGSLVLPLCPLVDGGVGLEVTVPPGLGVVERLVPLTWNEADGTPGAAFIALTFDHEALFIEAGGATAQFPWQVLDVTSTGTTVNTASPLLLFLREGDGGQVVTSWGRGQPERLITTLPVDDGGVDFPGRAVRLRAENGAVGVTFAKGGLIQYASALVCHGGPCRLGPVQSCPTSPALPPDIGLDVPDGGELSLLLSCPDQGTDFIYEVTDRGLSYVEPRQARSSWGTSRGHVRQGFWGQLSYSSALGEEFSDVLDGPPEVFGVVGHQLTAVLGRSIYGEEFGSDAGRPLGLTLYERIKPTIRAVPAGFVEGEELTLLESGAVYTLLEDGGSDLHYVLPTEPAKRGTIARMVSSPDGGRVLVVTTDGALHAGAEDPELTTLLAARLRPAPGFPINDWALRAADGGFLEGWAVANNRLFRITASTIERWKSSEVPVTGRDPLGVWFSGDALQLGTASGEVLSLPSRVRVVPPLLDGVTSITGLCGAIFATTNEAVWEVAPADAGQGEWLPVNLGPDVDGVYRPMLHRVDQRLFVIDEDAVVLELPVACP